jgi:hypothetical protein
MLVLFGFVMVLFSLGETSKNRERDKTRRIRIERLLLFERRAAPAHPWAPDGLELDRPTCVTPASSRQRGTSLLTAIIMA